jgi:hypothetical protein
MRGLTPKAVARRNDMARPGIQQVFFQFDFEHAIQRDRAERRLFRALDAGLPDTVSTVGGGGQEALVSRWRG